MRTVKSSWRLVALTPLCLASLVAPLTLTTLPATSAPTETPGATQQPSTPSGEPRLQPGTGSPTTELVDDSASPTEQSSPNEPSSPTSEPSSHETTESPPADPDDEITCRSTSTTKAPVTITFTGLAEGDEISHAPPAITGTVQITDSRVVYWPKGSDLRQEELNLQVTRDDEVITTCSVTVGPFAPSDSQSPSATSPPSPGQDPSPTSSPGPGTRPGDSGGQQPDAPPNTRDRANPTNRKNPRNRNSHHNLENRTNRVNPSNPAGPLSPAPSNQTAPVGPATRVAVSPTSSKLRAPRTSRRGGVMSPPDPPESSTMPLASDRIRAQPYDARHRAPMSSPLSNARQRRRCPGTRLRTPSKNVNKSN